MRCPGCGTENSEADSRFCGNCGGRIGRPTAEARVAPTIKITDDAKFPMFGNGDAQITNLRPNSPQHEVAPPGGPPSYQMASPVPLFPPIAPASRPPPDVMPRTPSLAPGAGVPRAISQPPQMPVTPVPLPRSISSPPGAHGSQPRPSEGLTVLERPSNRHLNPSTPAPVAGRTGHDGGSLPRGGSINELEVTPRGGGRRWGLIVLLLIIDLGLAGSGAVMLQRGLASGDVPAPPSTSPSKAP